MATTALPIPTRPTRKVAWFAWATLGYFIGVVLWGAVVRATDSGGGCGAHWPLCNGDFFPHHPRLATLIEFTHRSTSGVCAFLTIALAFWTFRRTSKHDPARKAVLWSAFFLVMEALLGAALVLRHWVEDNVSTGRTVAQSIHFTNTLLLMGALALTAWFLRGDTNDSAPPGGSRTLAWLAIAATIAVGATGSLAALADTLFPSKTLIAALQADLSSAAPVLVRMRWLHPAAAALSLVFVVALVRSIPRWTLLSKLVCGLLALQFVLGIGDVLLLAPTWMQILHLLGADLYWVALVVLAAAVVWPRSAIAAQPQATIWVRQSA
jgi:cytochrome c oxidase assembly protein subunit 15